MIYIHCCALHFRISVGNIDQFSNYTVAVTFVNNMGFESERAMKNIIGSKDMMCRTLFCEKKL